MWLLVLNENILIYWYFWYYLKLPGTLTLTFICTASTLFTFILHLHFYIYISFHHIGQSCSVLQNHSCMWCLVTFNGTFSFASQKGDGIARVDYLKVKNHVTRWKAIIPDRGETPTAPSFLLLSSSITSLCHNNLLHTTASGYKGWRK